MEGTVARDTLKGPARWSGPARPLAGVLVAAPAVLAFLHARTWQHSRPVARAIGRSSRPCAACPTGRLGGRTRDWLPAAQLLGVDGNTARTCALGLAHRYLDRRSPAHRRSAGGRQRRRSLVLPVHPCRRGVQERPASGGIPGEPPECIDPRIFRHPIRGGGTQPDQDDGGKPVSEGPLRHGQYRRRRGYSRTCWIDCGKTSSFR